MLWVSILVRKRLDLGHVLEVQYGRKGFGYLFFFFGKLTYVLKENDTKNIMGIPEIYNVNRNETNKWLQASHITKTKT